MCNAHMYMMQLAEIHLVLYKHSVTQYEQPPETSYLSELVTISELAAKMGAYIYGVF